jgi:glycosyltransferase involved in cell wall biosynthesis
MDIFVLPSLSEALSNSLMEAMGCGCCPVASDTGGNPELVIDGETGLLFPVGDAQALADRLALLLDQPHYRRHLAARAERRMHTHFTREQSARTMAAIYEEYLVGQASRPVGDGRSARETS